MGLLLVGMTNESVGAEDTFSAVETELVLKSDNFKYP
jgi:hypothetical protein